MKRTLLILGIAALATGCSDNDYRSNSQGAPPSAPSGGNADFTSFVVSQYAATNETAQPVQVDTTNFTFADDGNPDAFNTVIATAP